MIDTVSRLVFTPSETATWKTSVVGDATAGALNLAVAVLAFVSATAVPEI